MKQYGHLLAIPVDLCSDLIHARCHEGRWSVSVRNYTDAKEFGSNVFALYNLDQLETHEATASDNSVPSKPTKIYRFTQDSEAVDFKTAVELAG